MFSNDRKSEEDPSSRVIVCEEEEEGTAVSVLDEVVVGALEIAP